ncbi:uncharacterized protein A1O9_12552 [Exophiala aquamarina CBS 119918]|uniref:Uncharacterized protein n=1 Tax=Exophiala aquamarina CBS 119918 TaxID=1182545 RepID=A0A072NWJ0_9EURO|nr:uncharacterized protein A1O9_12552 [Exophiala aquamarina CBS 119918]KEF51403.1 hypothetical protein A1O9_12552 [Exophiala aquamarina CBS 119918]
MFPYLDLSPLSDAEDATWRSKTGFYSEHDDAVKMRAMKLRETLRKDGSILRKVLEAKRGFGHAWCFYEGFNKRQQH